MKLYELFEAAVTTMQPRGEKPFKPNMDAPKKKYPAIGTLAWEKLPKWKQDELMKQRGHIKEDLSNPHSVQLEKGLTHKEALKQAPWKKSYGDCRGFSYNKKTGIAVWI